MRYSSDEWNEPPAHFYPFTVWSDVNRKPLLHFARLILGSVLLSLRGRTTEMSVACSNNDFCLPLTHQ